jgi:amino acid transporter
LAIIIGSVMAILFAVVGLIQFVGYVIGFASLLIFALVNLSLIKLRRDKPELSRPFRTPLYPYTPIIGFTFALLLIIFVESSAIILGIEFLLIALIFYHLKMVGYSRLRLAVGGINLGIGSFMFLIYYFIEKKIVILNLPWQIQNIFPYFIFLIGLFYLLSGFLNLRNRNKETK